MTAAARVRSKFATLLATAILVLATTASPISAKSGPLQSAFSAAASEFGVPEEVLLAVSYTLTRWEANAAPSAAGGFGPMQLIDAAAADRGRKGDGVAHPDVNGNGRGATIAAAAAATGTSAQRLKTDASHNIRGGAALLAQYARETTGATPRDAARWYGAVAKYTGSDERSVATGFADAAFATINGGAARRLRDGETVTLVATSVRPDVSTADALELLDRRHTSFDCPKALKCRFIPAAYHQNNPRDPGDYGNFDLARRESVGLDVRFIVIHDAETDYQTTIKIFQDPLNYVSAHYVFRASDGDVTQMVDNKNVGWHAGNWNVNMHAIGYEHEGFAIQGTTWYTDAAYRASATLTAYLAAKYGIPLDRGHIIGHDDIPGPTDAFVRGMHWDPGPYWDWARYMELAGAPIIPTATSGNVITIRPDFATNMPPVRDCEGGGALMPPQPASFIYVHTAPSFTAPLANDPYLNTGGTQCANDWGDKAVTGQLFYRAETQGDWDAIWFAGQKVWIHNPGGANTVRSRGTVITPKAGLSRIDVYGRAYPESISTARLTRYSIAAGQSYVAYEKVRGAYYEATTFDDLESYRLHTTTTEFYLIQYNHRLAFVKASDVDVVGGS
jgi:N-acetyl-anhydromuramyl-L-alanine amidase AmpD